MNIRLGNLTVEQIENRLGIEFPKDLQNELKLSNQPEASNIQKGKWHCFDIPFEIVFGDLEYATKFYNSLKAQASKCKEPLRISIQN